MYRFFFLFLLLLAPAAVADDTRPRLIVETDAGGDPDDEQSLVRLLVYADEFDIVGIIANRPTARDGENQNPVRDGLGIVRRMVRAYGQCRGNLVRHDPRYPTAEQLLAVTVPGYNDVTDGVELVIRAVDSPDPRPLWFGNWGTDRGSGASSLLRALDRVRRERGPESYAKFKRRIHLCSDNAFGEHTGTIDPPFPIWIHASHPELDGKRWYHRFSALTATAGGFDIERDVRNGHGPLGAMYPTNTTHPQKEGDTMYFLYLVPTGMNDPLEPGWGSWAGRYGQNDLFPGKPYYWANVQDAWNGRTHRECTLARWAVALQNDFAARMDWCVADTFSKANHNPIARLNGDGTKRILTLTAKSGTTVALSAAGSTDPDGNAFDTRWFVYPEAGTYRGKVTLATDHGDTTSFSAPTVMKPETIHVILELQDRGTPRLFAFRRAVVTVSP
ncbi:MAG: DUF1593 domain-containing protein [Pirellulales bacterium]